MYVNSNFKTSCHTFFHLNVLLNTRIENLLRSKFVNQFTPLIVCICWILALIQSYIKYETIGIGTVLDFSV